MGRSKKLVALGIVCSLLFRRMRKTSDSRNTPEPKAATEAASEQNPGKSGYRERRRPSGLHGGEQQPGISSIIRLTICLWRNILMWKSYGESWMERLLDRTVNRICQQEAPLMSYSSNQSDWRILFKNVLAPLDDYVASGTINPDNWNEGFVDTGLVMTICTWFPWE